MKNKEEEANKTIKDKNTNNTIIIAKAINTISNIITNIIDVISNNIIVIVLKKKNM